MNYEVQKFKKNRTNTTDIVHVTNLKLFNQPAEFQSNAIPQENNHTQKACPKKHQENENLMQSENSKTRRPGKRRKQALEIQPPTQQTGNRSTRNRRPPQRLGIIQALFQIDKPMTK